MPCRILLLFSIQSMLVSCENSSNPEPFNIKPNILILGNSITQNRPLPERGWIGDWGMAASSRQNDYVHILIDSVYKYYPEASFLWTGSGVIFEREYTSYDPFASYEHLLKFNPDYVIIRLGENVVDSLVITQSFETHFTELLDFFNEDGNTQFLIVTSFWDRPQTTIAMTSVADSMGLPLINLADLSTDSTNLAFHSFKDFSIARHPGDQGMIQVANRIWNVMKLVLQHNPED